METEGKRAVNFVVWREEIGRDTERKKGERRQRFEADELAR